MMDYFSGLFFAMAESESESVKVKQNYPFYYGLQYVYSGKVFLRIDRGPDLHLNGPVVFLTSPGHYFEYWNDSNRPRHHLWCCFQGPRVERMIAGGLLPVTLPTPVFIPPSPQAFLDGMRELIALASSERGTERAVIRLEELLYKLQEPTGLETPAPSPHRDFIETLRNEIDLYPEQEWNFEEEAKKRFISLNHLNRLFRTFCRTSPRHAVIDSRMRRAAGLLLETGDSVREIAQAVGLENEFYFSRLFKQKYHLSPSGYRKEFRGD